MRRSDGPTIFEYKLHYSKTQLPPGSDSSFEKKDGNGDSKLLRKAVLTWENEFGVIIQFHPNRFSDDPEFAVDMNG